MVTLVNSAVDNFYGRISGLVKAGGLLPHAGYRVRTLHGLAHDIVRERPALVGLSDKFDIVDERAADEVLSEAAGSWLRSNPFALDDYLNQALETSKLKWVRGDPLLDLVKEIASGLHPTGQGPAGDAGQAGGTDRRACSIRCRWQRWARRSTPTISGRWPIAARWTSMT